MATSDSLPVSLTAGADHSSNLYKFGKINSSGLVVICSVAGERADCVIGSKPSASGDGMDGWVERRIPVMCGGTVTAGDSLATDANGKAVTATSGQYANGIALESGTTGAVIAMLKPMSQPVSGGVQSLSSNGAVTVTADVVLLTVSGTRAYTLADGALGKEIEIICVSAGSTPHGVLTIATCYGSQSTTHDFTTADQRLRLVMTATGWKVMAKNRVGSLTVVVGTDVLTGLDMVRTYNLSVTGTVASTTTKGIPNGQVEGEEIWVRCTTAAATPDGSISGAYEVLATGAAGTSMAVNATTDYAAFRWNGSAWLNFINNSAAIT